ncbi:ankyrin repeat-containing protein NPR4-like isoform X3 [Papaver somniferum]|uniref:ankyrin repeat-containing protein NPR4-like isoform X3 n=1 Tax=Papaver somniferum TaxID=3469 RepID=UPI000E7028A0|nr:ankyrin repeat-containing protein NPR4-like isoform X3 [Papaver somniferum]
METTGSTATEGVPSVEISIPTEQRSFSYDHYYQTTDYGRNLDLYRPLLEAAMENKWTSVTDLINNHPSSVEVPITICGRTALHIAAGAGHSTFVLKLVELMPAEALELKDKYDELAYNLIREHPSLATAQEDNGNTMLDVLAEDCNVQRPAFVRQSAMYFQLSRTRQYRFIDKPSTFLEMLFYPGPIYRGFRSEQLRSSIILPELVKIIFEEVSHMSKEDMYPFFFRSNFLKIAAETGSIEILKRCISTYPDQLWFPREGRNIFQLAVENRQDNIFDYLYDHMNADEKILTTRTVDSNGGNILHVAAKIAPPSRLNIYSRPVLQMQREINWYKKVENRVPPALRKMRNDQGETPPEVFTREHKDLVKNAEAYMIRTAESCLIVAALVATVAFAAAFTAPGGNFSDSDATNKGKPIFLGKKSFLLFMVLDALALFSSTYSIQVFLSAYGMTHSEARYQSVIPTKLMMGFVCLKISVVSVMIAFSIALSIILGNTYVWAPYVIGGVACFCSSPSLGYLFGLRLNHVAIYYPKNF